MGIAQSYIYKIAKMLNTCRSCTPQSKTCTKKRDEQNNGRTESKMQSIAKCQNSFSKIYFPLTLMHLQVWRNFFFGAGEGVGSNQIFIIKFACLKNLNDMCKINEFWACHNETTCTAAVFQWRHSKFVKNTSVPFKTCFLKNNKFNFKSKLVHVRVWQNYCAF